MYTEKVWNKYSGLFPVFLCVLYHKIDPCPMIVLDVNIRGSWEKGTQNSELFLQLFCKPQIISKWKVFLKSLEE